MSLRGVLSLLALAALLPAAPALAAAVERSVVVSRVSEQAAAVAPRVAVAPDGTSYLLWVEKGPAQPGRGHASEDDLYLARWPADQAAPLPPVRINPVPGSAKASAVIRPQLILGPTGTLHVLYPANARSPVNGKPVIDVHYQRSRDGGLSFSAPATLNSPSPNDLTASSHSDVAAAASFPALAAGPAGQVLALWLDSRHVVHAEDPSDVYAAVSADDGVRWSPDRRLFGGQVCECCQPVAAATSDAVLLSSRHVDGEGHRDPILSRIGYDLAVAADAARIGMGRWDIEGCPMKATAVAADSRRVYVAWYSQADAPAGVWFAASTDGGRRFDAGRPLHVEAEVADAPVIAVEGEGRVVAAWHAKAGGDRRIYMARSDDGGRTFSSPVALSPADEPAGYPSIATDSGRTVVTWQQGKTVRALRLDAATQGPEAADLRLSQTR